MADDQQHNPQIRYTWEAPLRPYIKRNPEVIRFYIALALLLSIIVVLFGDYILLLPLWALLFIFYIFTVTPPQDITNKITQFGIETADVTLRWEVLSHFYYTERFGYTVLVIVMHPPYYQHIYLVVPHEESKKKITSLLGEHLLYQERPVRTFMDRLIEWFSKLVPHEEVSREQTSSQKHAQASP